jgi:hypothetical protein
MEKQCPGCGGTKLEMLPGRRFLCRSCRLEMSTKQAESRDSWYLISIPHDARPDRVEDSTSINIASFNARAEAMNNNHRANARRGMVIDRGGLAIARRGY